MKALAASGTLFPFDQRAEPNLGQLDFLGRMPIPLRRPFKSGLDQTVAAHRAATGNELACWFLNGAEWFRPFDLLAASNAVAEAPGLLVSPFYHDLLSPNILKHYSPGRTQRLANCHPACLAAGLADPLGLFRIFAVVPFVFLVDQTRLRGRPAPRSWADLLKPCWAGEIVFGGWRPNSQTPYQDYNDFLLLALGQEFGSAGLEAFAFNVLRLQHNVRTASLAGSNSREVGTIAVLPWLQADLNPRRQRTQVVWPSDGALAMPIVYLLKPGAEQRVRPLVDYLTGLDLAKMLSHNRYPPSHPQLAGAFPAGAQLKWPGWEYLRSCDVAAESQKAAAIFFTAWEQRGLQACA